MKDKELGIFLKNLTDKNYANDVFNFLKKELNKKNNLDDITDTILTKVSDVKNNTDQTRDFRRLLSKIDLEKSKEEFKEKRKYINVEEIETKEDLLEIYEKIKDLSFFKLLNIHYSRGRLTAFFNNLIKMRDNSFESFLSNIDLEDREKKIIDLNINEKTTFYNKFSDFSYVNYNNWDSMEKDESFAYHLEWKSNFVGSGFLGNNSNRLFYYVKGDREDRGEYKVISTFKKKYPKLSNEEIFAIFYKECNDWINTPLSEVDSFKFDLLNGANIISSKLYNLFSKTPTLCINSVSFAKSLSALFSEVKYSDIPIVFARNLEEYLYENYPELKGLDKNTISEMLWGYKGLFEKGEESLFDQYLNSKDVLKFSQKRRQKETPYIDEFYSKFSKDFLESMEIEDWDNKDSSKSLSNYIINRTGFLGGAYLGSNSNKVIYYNKNIDDYKVRDDIAKKYPDKDVKEIFVMFKEELLNFIDTPIDEVNNFKFDILKNQIVLTTAIYNLFSDYGTIGLNSVKYAKEVNELFGNISTKENTLQIANDVEFFIKENYKNLSTLDSIDISGIVWDFYCWNGYENKKGGNMEKLFESHNIIYAGAPGTGKSHMIDEDLSDVDEFVTRVTFYPDYEYHDFVGSILPKLDEDGNVKYEFNPGPFTSILKSAINDIDNNYYLVIEEMSRGNCASIFGDIFQLLDRDEEGNSKYGINNELMAKELDIEGKVKLPSNLYILGTVNTSDQNVFVMDTAFKRRFDFKYLSVEDKQEEIGDIKFLDVYWKDFYLKLNEFIIDNLNISEDKQLGPFFINKDDQNTKVIMYLYEDIIGTYRNNKDLFNDNIKTLTNALRVSTIEELFSEEFIEFYRDTNED